MTLTIDIGKTTNIAILDNCPITRYGIMNLVDSLEGYKVIIEVSKGEELLEQLNRLALQPDICIIDVSNTVNCFTVLKELKRKAPSTKVLVFSSLNNDYIILQMLRNGANGFLEKKSSTRQFMRALGSLSYTDYYHPESLARRIFDIQHQNSPVIPKITEREMEFLGHCCTELSYKEIGQLMGISVRTVEAFRNALFSKFNLKTRIGLAIYALQNGIVSLNND